MGKLREADRLRLQADLVEAEEAVSEAKAKRGECGECGQLLPYTKAQEKAVKAAQDKARPLRRQLREDREQE